MDTAPLVVTESKSGHFDTTTRALLSSKADAKAKKKRMKKEYDFSKGKRGAVIKHVGTTRITIYLDDAILNGFKAQSERTGKGYQTLNGEPRRKQRGIGSNRSNNRSKLRGINPKQ